MILIATSDEIVVTETLTEKWVQPKLDRILFHNRASQKKNHQKMAKN